MITEEYRRTVREWMQTNLPKYEYGSSFDLAVDCAYDLELWEDNYVIPQWIVEEAESLSGKDLKNKDVCPTHSNRRGTNPG